MYTTRKSALTVIKNAVLLKYSKMGKLRCRAKPPIKVPIWLDTSSTYGNVQHSKVLTNILAVFHNQRFVFFCM